MGFIRKCIFIANSSAKLTIMQ